MGIMFKQKGGDQISENTDNIARIQVQLDSLKQVVDNFLKGESKTVTQEQPESVAPPTTVTQEQPESVPSPTTVTQEQAASEATTVTPKNCDKFRGRECDPKRFLYLKDSDEKPWQITHCHQENKNAASVRLRKPSKKIKDNDLLCLPNKGGKKSNKRNKKVLKRTNKKIGGNCQNLALVNNKLNIYAQPQISQGTTRSFTGNYKINGPLPRGSLVPRAIEQVNLRKNVLPGGKKSKKKKKKKLEKKRHKKKKKKKKKK